MFVQIYEFVQVIPCMSGIWYRYCKCYITDADESSDGIPYIRPDVCTVQYAQQSYQFCIAGSYGRTTLLPGTTCTALQSA